eukprot:TRINITY_DN31362_c0_g1_i2.p1 TRINITY_DN31362_c0_g1~~TRINITY_DN31362_c0_g1_i2.p1  ORF type:complete len:150 (+),score=19.76 TRINITY_DN31362_c0_g1_i2:59-451(+)
MCIRDRVNTVCALQDPELMASGSSDKSVRVWRYMTGECMKILQGHLERIKCVRALNEPHCLVSSCGGFQDNSIKIWNYVLGECTKTLTGHGGIVYSICSLDGDHIASGSEDLTVRIWSLKQKCVYQGLFE